MPVFNSGFYLEETIKSILTQSYKDFQLIIIDDGSTDDSYLIAQKFADNDSRILLLHQENQGVSIARNKGLKHVKGNILIFVDSDDRLCEKALEKIEYEMSFHDYDLLIYSWNNIVNEKKEPFIINEKNSSLSYVYKSITRHDFKCGGGFPWNKAWKVSSILLNDDNLLCFDVIEFYEDKLWTLKSLDLMHNPKIGFCAKPLYDYFVRSNSLSHAKTTKRMKHLNYSSIECLKKIKDYVISKHSDYGQLVDDAINTHILYALWWDIKNKNWDYNSENYYNKLKFKIGSIKELMLFLIIVIYKKLPLKNQG